MQFIWAGIIIAALVIEALSAELISIWFAPAAAISLIVSFFQPDAIWLQVIIFVVLAFIFVLLSRTIFKKHFEVSNVPTNLDTVIGDTAIVVEDICNVEERGAVKLQGKIWTARAVGDEIIEKDALVTVIEIKGVKLICKVKE